VTVLDESNAEWVKVKYKSYEGFVSAEYVDVKTTYQYAESREEERARLEKEAAANRNKQPSSKPANPNKVYNAPTTGNGAGVVEYAVQFVGNPYVYGGTSLTIMSGSMFITMFFTYPAH
jgi:cell wall-associated NlpC family hydrolase